MKTIKDAVYEVCWYLTDKEKEKVLAHMDECPELYYAFKRLVEIRLGCEIE